MLIPCPACGKQNETDVPDACARCACDLSALGGILAAAARQLHRAKADLRERNWSKALAHAERSWQLVHTPHNVRVACLATAALRDMDRLAQWRRRAEALAGE